MDERKLFDQLVAERDSMDSAFVNAIRLLDGEIERMKAKASGLAPGEIVLTDKIYIPVDENPGYNFVGKLLGPKGITLKKMQMDTQTKMTILGKGSIKDRAKEDSLRNTNEKEWEHLHDDLHVYIEAKGPPNIAKAKLAAANAEVKKMLIPQVEPNFDAIRQEQRMMMGLIPPPPHNTAPPPQESIGTPIARGRGRGGRGRGGRGALHSPQPQLRGGIHRGRGHPPLPHMPDIMMRPDVMDSGHRSRDREEKYFEMDIQDGFNRSIADDWKSGPLRNNRNSQRDRPYDRIHSDFGHGLKDNNFHHRNYNSSY